MSAERLAIGDLVRCTRCRHWHPAEQPASGSSTDYAERMLFMRCGAGWLYVGQLGLPARDPRGVAMSFLRHPNHRFGRQH